MIIIRLDSGRGHVKYGYCVYFRFSVDFILSSAILSLLTQTMIDFKGEKWGHLHVQFFLINRIHFITLKEIPFNYMRTIS